MLFGENQYIMRSVIVQNLLFSTLRLMLFVGTGSARVQLAAREVHGSFVDGVPDFELLKLPRPCFVACCADKLGLPDWRLCDRIGTSIRGEVLRDLCTSYIEGELYGCSSAPGAIGDDSDDTLFRLDLESVASGPNGGASPALVFNCIRGLAGVGVGQVGPLTEPDDWSKFS